jgi:hypothetical protein
MERSISERYSNDLGLSTIQKPGPEGHAIDAAIGEPSDAETTLHTKHKLVPSGLIRGSLFVKDFMLLPDW